MVNGIEESLLHFIWRFQHFTGNQLRTTTGDSLELYFNGSWNHNSGPDFMGAKIMVGSMLWFGNVEIHVRSSDWNSHGHQSDINYNNVVLHVVWEDNKPVLNADGQTIPTLELKDRVDPRLLDRYSKLMNSQESLPCGGQLSKTKRVDWQDMLQSTVVERLEKKSQNVQVLLKKNKMDWEETTYQLLASNFGFKINNAPFLKMAQVLPLKRLVKHAGDIFQIEAILFGSAGLLDSKTDAYQCELKKEYDFLAHKYSIRRRALYPVEWRKLRLRPGNFPTVRIAQLAALINGNPHFFDTMVHVNSLDDVQKMLRADVSPYWKEHYDFGKKTKGGRDGRMGMASVQNLIVNTAIPVIMAYSKYSNNPTLIDRSLNWLEFLNAENNKITRMWKNHGRHASNAFDSQGLIHLYNEYCLKKRCLSCKIGVGHIHRA